MLGVFAVSGMVDESVMVFREEQESEVLSVIQCCKGISCVGFTDAEKE